MTPTLRDKTRGAARAARGHRPSIDLRFVAQVGPVIGTYTGPGAVALFFIPE